VSQAWGAIVGGEIVATAGLSQIETAFVPLVRSGNDIGMA
jgi:hypothetical protein